MRVGFTGTQRGMTDEQVQRVRKILVGLNGLREDDRFECHHGDCIGADEEFHVILEWFRDRGVPVTIIGHPPKNDKKRAFCEFDEMRVEKEYLDRNHDIVDEVEVMIATPKEVDEQWRGSGTWATIRYAKKQGKYLFIVFPDGEMA